MNSKTDAGSKLAEWNSRRRILALTKKIQAHARPRTDLKPIVFFNASARLGGLSQNAAFSFLSSSGLRLAGLPIHYFVCNKGMSHCVLGVNREDYHAAPPCDACIRQSHRLYHGSQVYWFSNNPDPVLSEKLAELDIAALSTFETSITQESEEKEISLPLGAFVLPSIRWALRRHTLPDDPETRYLLREFILSAENLAREFARYLSNIKPMLAVIFNGIMFPEAVARSIASQLGVRVVTHEVGFQHFSAFFTDGEATTYPIPIPPQFTLNDRQNQLLDEYLENRFQGKFTMAGIRFWPEMRGLDQDFLEKAGRFRQVVPVFTNVIYDTSQVHANQVFSFMFEWLELILEIIREHPETYFVIRAHPDEMRPGTAKLSRESVRDWVKERGVDNLDHVRFIDSQDYLSSYELIQRAKFVMVYNSSIGMEAALLGAAVLCGGKARYTQYPMVFFPQTPQAYREAAERFLTVDEIEVPSEFKKNARRFLYYQLYRASLSFEKYLEEGRRKGYVQLRSFSWQELLPQKSPTIQLLEKAILENPCPDSFLQEDFLES